jgi:tRNA(Ile)-lysidine synthase
MRGMDGIAPNDHSVIVVGVSGGKDSMLLLHLLHSASYDIIAAHVNYGLRGEESNGDEKFVREFCEQRDIQLVVERANPDELRKGNLQANARKVRYDFFESIASRFDKAYIAVAHHSNDQVETILMKWLRGSYRFFPLGMKQRTPRIIRPLLEYSAEEVHWFVQGLGLQWREDSSNLKLDYTRNKIRHRVIPALSEATEHFSEEILRQHERWKLYDGYMESRLEQEIRDFVKKENGKTELSFGFIQNDGFDHLRIQYAFQDYGITLGNASEILKLKDAESGKRWVSGAVEIWRQRDGWLAFRPETEERQEWIIGEEMTEVNAAVKLSLEHRHGKPAIETDRNVALIDADKLKFPLLLRHWKQGDRFQPLGMKGEKLISDFLIQEKIEQKDKEQVLVLESDGQICWVVGLRVADAFKITETTEACWRLEVK